MTAIRGLMWGSPEFVELAKASEKRGELDELIEELYETTGEIIELSDELTETQRQQLRYVLTDIFEMVGD